MSKIEIYSLSCPDTGIIRYIGKANDSQKRLKSHIRDSRRRNTPVYCWLRKLLSDNKMPLLNIMQVTTDDAWREVEIALIAKNKINGKLLNIALGGDEPFCSKETRAENGRLVAKNIHLDPLQKRLWYLKQQFMAHRFWAKKNGKIDQYNKSLQKGKYLADKYPLTCGNLR